MIRVLVADDHAVVRRGVVQILAESGDILPVGEAASGRQALQAIREQPYDVLLLDIAMPDGGGLEILTQALALKPGLRVLILSMYPEKQYALRALKSGASGYLTKDSAPDELVAAIRKVAQGGKYVSQALADELVDALTSQGEKPPHALLSDREHQVLLMLAAGKTVGEIAAEIPLSVKTVSTYRRRILEKLGLKTTAALIRYAMEQGLIA